MIHRLLILVVLLVPLCGCSSATRDESINVLIFTHTQGFRHDSIPAGTKALHRLCFDAAYACVSTEDASFFTAENLAQFRVIVFLNTTGDILNDEQQRAFENWFRTKDSFRGFVGIHSAADTEYDWPFYQSMLGGHFTGHPPVQSAVVVCDDHTHPSTRHLPERWQRTDEWYNYAPNPRDSNAVILLTLDTNSYEGSTMPGDHPIAWCREINGNRAFYTGGGHTIESFAEPMFLEHLAGGLRWAAHHDE